MIRLLYNLIVMIIINYVFAGDYSFINLPSEHLSTYFYSYPRIKDKCETDENCPFKGYVNTTSCWGYEDACTEQNRVSNLSCPGDHSGWVKTKEAQIDSFFVQGDFGYVKEQRDEMMLLCEPTFAHDSSLECSKFLRFCRGRNLMINFTDLDTRTEPVRYHMDVLTEGQIGGHCRSNRTRLEENLDHHSPLQSWAPELKHFRETHHKPGLGDECDIVVTDPVFIMKIDATINMYHHFCDFFNLYTSLHVNSSHFEAFSTKVKILIWETYTYASPFEETFKAFTDSPVLNLNNFTGKNVCFRNVVFSLLPRMIFGLYYNTPLIQGCQKSSLFEAFSRHILHRLKIKKIGDSQMNLVLGKPESSGKPIKNKTMSLRHGRNSVPDNLNMDKIVITLLSRDTKYRRILNEPELLMQINKTSRYVVNRVVYNRQMPFLTQLAHTISTDILIGMHGAGLTHLLFLPPHAVVLELYHCEDKTCYLDLARLKGVKYLTWERDDLVYKEDEGHHPDGGSHPKFTNYSFDPKEFSRLIAKAAQHIAKHKPRQGKSITAKDEL